MDQLVTLFCMVTRKEKKGSKQKESRRQTGAISFKGRGSNIGISQVRTLLAFENLEVEGVSPAHCIVKINHITKI